MGFYTDPTMTLQTTPNRTQSQALQERAERYFPGGVNSPVRAFRAVGGNPPFVESGEGAYLIDAEAGFEIWQGGQGLATGVGQEVAIAEAPQRRHLALLLGAVGRRRDEAAPASPSIAPPTVD